MSEALRPTALHSVDQVCERLRMSRPTFYRKYADGTAPRTTRFGRRIFVTEAALEDYLVRQASQRNKTTGATPSSPTSTMTARRSTAASMTTPGTSCN